MGQSSGGASTVNIEVGQATWGDLQTRVNRIYNRFQFRTSQEVGPPAIVVETEWKARTPFEDELDAGVTAARSRLLVRGRQRPGATGSITLYVVNFYVETQVRTESSADWVEVPASEQLKSWATEMADELRLELEKIRTD